MPCDANKTRMVNRRPMSDQGAANLRKTSSYQRALVSLRSENRVRTAAASGMPRKTATDWATVWYSISRVPSSPEMTFMKRRASGA